MFGINNNFVLLLLEQILLYNSCTLGVVVEFVVEVVVSVVDELVTVENNVVSVVDIAVENIVVSVVDELAKE